MKKEIEELKALGADVIELNNGLKLIGDWSEKYNKYHNLFVEITGKLYTSYTTQHKDFLRNLASLGCLYTYDIAQHKDFLRNLASLGGLYTYDIAQHKDFLRNLASLGGLYTSDATQHKDFLRNLTSLGGLYTSYAIQHKDFLRNTKSTFDLPFIYADGILSIVKSTKEINGVIIHNTNRVGYLDIEYIAEQDGVFTHAKTIDLALIDLRFKQSNRDTNWLKDKKPSDELNFSDAVLAYRCVTGACSGGVEGFLNKHNKKEKYNISEIIELTKNEYGNESFAEFFK